MIVATIASLSTRESLLQQVIASLISQVDAVCVYLNGYDTAPAFLRHPKVLHAVLSKEAGWRGAEAKLWFWDRSAFKAAPEWKDDDVALICDDDIIYPPDYAERMVAELDARPGTIACVHGSIMMEPFDRYSTSRWIAKARGPLERATRVHIPGTGTTAFRRGDLDFELGRDVTWSHCVDVMLAIAAKRQGVECWSVPRPDGWLTPMALPSGTVIYRQRTGAGNDQVETDKLREAGPWEPLEHSTGMKHRGAPSVLRRYLRKSPGAMVPRELVEFLAPRIASVSRAGAHFVELGSGHGTVGIVGVLPRGMRLFSIEHDPRYIGLVSDTTYVHAPIVNGWYNPTVIDQMLPPAKDIAAVLVDGPPGKIGRAGLLKHLDRFGSGPVIVDDVHRSAELELAKAIAARRGAELKVHECPGRAFGSIGWP